MVMNDGDDDDDDDVDIDEGNKYRDLPSHNIL
jgi:hypothetical protein